MFRHTSTAAVRAGMTYEFKSQIKAKAMPDGSPLDLSRAESVPNLTRRVGTTSARPSVVDRGSRWTEAKSRVGRVVPTASDGDTSTTPMLSNRCPGLTSIVQSMLRHVAAVGCDQESAGRQQELEFSGRRASEQRARGLVIVTEPNVGRPPPF